MKSKVVLIYFVIIGLFTIGCNSEISSNTYTYEMASGDWTVEIDNSLELID